MPDDPNAIPDLPPLDEPASAKAAPRSQAAPDDPNALPDLPPLEESQGEPEPTHGGWVEGLKTAGEGLARGVTAGLSDIAESKILGNREDIAARKAEHPWIAGASELTGFAAPALADLASGGTLTPEIAAAEGASKGASLTGLAAHALEYSPAGLIGKLGGATDAAVGKVLGSKVAGTALGRIAGMAAAGGAENAAFGVGNQLSEDALGDAPTTADKLMAAATHNGLMGLVLGGAIGTAGEVLSPLFRSVGSKLDKASDVEAAHALGLDKRTLTQAGKRFGGADSVRNLGTIANEEGLLGDTAAQKIGSDASQMLERTQAKIQERGQEIGELGDKYNVNVSAKEILQQYDNAIAEMSGNARKADAAYQDALAKAGDNTQAKAAAKAAYDKSVEAGQSSIGKGTREYLQKQRDVLAEDLGYSGKDVTTQVKLSDAEKAEWIQNNKDEAGRAMLTGDWPPPSQLKTITTKAKDVDIPLSRVITERQAIGERAGFKSIEASAEQKALQKIYGKMTDFEESSIDKAARQIGGESADDAGKLRDLKRRFQGLKLIESGLEKRAASEAGGHNIGLGAKLAGAAAFVSHGPLLAAGTLFGAHLAGEKGSAIASHVLGKLSRLDMLARATREVDSELKNSVGVLSGRTKPRVRLKRFAGPSDNASVEEKADYVHAHSVAKTATLEQLNEAMPGLSKHAPKTAGALIQKLNLAAQYIASQRPRQLNQPSLLDPTAKPRYADADVERSFESIRAAQDPVGVLSEAMETGRIGPHEIEAIQSTHPDLFKELQKDVLAELSDPKVGGQIPVKSANVIAQLFGVAADPAYSAQGVAAYQAAYQSGAPSGQEPAGAQPKGNPALGKVGIMKNLAGASELPLERAAAH